MEVVLRTVAFSSYKHFLLLLPVHVGPGSPSRAFVLADLPAPRGDSKPTVLAFWS